MATQVVQTTANIHGEAERRKREEIALLALILLADTATIDRYWNSLAPRRWRGLLTATVVTSRDELPDPPPQFWFDVTRQQYGTTDRGYIPHAAIRAAVLAVIASAQTRFRAFTSSMVQGDLAIGEWQTILEAQIKQLNLANAAAGRGAVERLTATDLTAVSDRLRFQYKRLTRFAIEVEQQSPRADTPEKIEHRAELYAATSEISFHETRRKSFEDAGFTEERRFLHPAEHCTPEGDLPSCPELASRGWQPIGSMPDPGEGTPCMWNCKCSKEFRRT